MYETLKLGSKGDNVIILQQKLKKIGLFNAIINGNFGLSTEIGVKEFQKEVGLEDNGVVDRLTWTMLNNYTEEAVNRNERYVILTNPPISTDIKDVQQKLKVLLYYTGPINGIYNLETENAIKRFQLNNDLTPNGEVTQQTMNLIDMLYGNLSDCAKDLDVDLDNSEDNSYQIYTVSRGDTLYSIARKFNTTVDNIKSLNNLANNTIVLGQNLKVPSYNSNNNSNSYIVSRGDTLYSIARKFNTTVDEIKRINNLTSNTLTIGQVLMIPSNESNNYINYVVVNGDTLYSIAKKYNVSVDSIKSLNNLTNNFISIGQIIKIPTSNTR